MLPAASTYAADRAVGELRRGRPVLLDGATFAAAETLSPDVLGLLRSVGQPFLFLPLQRALVLHVRTAGVDPVALPVPADMAAADLATLADATLDLDHPLRGPFQAQPAPPLPAGPAIALAKAAHLLPVVLGVAGVAPGDWLGLTAEQAAAAPQGLGALRRVAQAQVPLAEAEDAKVVAFRPGDGSLEHLAILVGDPLQVDGPPPLVRLHSECFTGDLLASLRCDCGPQLQGALAAMRAAGRGILLYLAQEGRGIGLVNKLRAYRLQDLGFDTIDANLRLGFGEDERLFEPAAEMLRQLGVRRIRLLTNNPAKLGGLAALGIEVVERVPHAFPANRHNDAYLAAKKRRSGHLL